MTKLWVPPCWTNPPIKGGIDSMLDSGHYSMIGPVYFFRPRDHNRHYDPNYFYRFSPSNQFIDGGLLSKQEIFELIGEENFNDLIKQADLSNRR